MNPEQIKSLIELRNKGASWEDLKKQFKGRTSNSLRKTFYRHIDKPAVRALVFDIETKPLLAYVWGLWDNNVALNQIENDWSVLSWSAKWLDAPDDEVMYADNRKSKDLDDDKSLLEQIWKLLDEADIVITHYGKKFDVPKLYARFIKHGMNPPSSFRHIDTKQIASSKFAFTSNKLEYLAKFLGVKHTKLTERKFAGQLMWTGCIKGIKAAWEEMKAYNIRDTIVLQEVFHVLKKWDKSINFDVYHDGLENVCTCGGKSFIIHKLSPYIYTNTGKFDRLICTNSKCGKELKGKTNLLPMAKRKSLKG
mgnify:CR=1 FL=1